WYLMDKVFKLPFTPLSTRALKGDLSKYTCIVFPPGANALTDPLKNWIKGGGCAVVMGPPDWVLGDQGLLKLDASKVGDNDPGWLPGSLFLGHLDSRLFLSYGYGGTGGQIPIALPVEGSGFYKAPAAGGAVVSFSGDEKVKKLLSGWEWPDDTE